MLGEVYVGSRGQPGGASALDRYIGTIILRHLRGRRDLRGPRALKRNDLVAHC